MVSWPAHGRCGSGLGALTRSRFGDKTVTTTWCQSCGRSVRVAQAAALSRHAWQAENGRKHHARSSYRKSW
eukprot:2741152-Rhodomonas_salina.1